MENAKEMICAICGAIGSAVCWFFGGWDHYLISLGLLMILDIIMAVVAAWVFGSSKKTETGKVSSRAFVKGLGKKVLMLLMLAVAHIIDFLLGATYVRDAVAIFLCVNEIISILETWKLTGFHVPKVLEEALEVIQHKADGEQHG